MPELVVAFPYIKGFSSTVGVVPRLNLAKSRLILAIWQALAIPHFDPICRHTRPDEQRGGLIWLIRQLARYAQHRQRRVA